MGLGLFDVQLRGKHFKRTELVSWKSTTYKSNNNNKRDFVDLEDLCLIFSATDNDVIHLAHTTYDHLKQLPFFIGYCLTY